MVYCSKCGHQNPDDAEKCSSCGQPITTRPFQRKSSRKGDDCFGPEREWENECFGLPHGGMIFAVVVGVVIIFFGLTMILGDLFEINIDFWETIGPLLIIIVGILIIAGVLSRSRR